MIQSHLIKTSTTQQLLIFDTIADSKHLYTACAVGTVENGDAALSDVGQKTVDALLAHAQNAGDLGQNLRFQEIATVAAAPIKVRKALQAADHKDAVIFVCRNHHVYDAAVAELQPIWTQAAPPQ